MIAETLAGIALVKSAVDGIKSTINTANDIGEIAKYVDNLLEGEKQVQQQRAKKSGSSISEQFMLIEHLSGELEKLTAEIETGKAPFDQQQKLTLDFYEKRIANLEGQIEKLKDAQMEMTHKKLVQ